MKRPSASQGDGRERRVHRTSRGAAALAAALFAALAAGCAGPGATERFFALNDGGVVQSTTAVVPPAPLSSTLPGIVVSSVTVPELVDRPQIVTRDSANRVVVSEQNLWAEPVRASVGRMLAARLARALVEAGRPTQVAAYPQASIVEPYLRVTIDVVRFDAVPNGEAVVDALWSVRRTSDGFVRTGRTVASAPIAGADYDAIVSSWNEALGTVNRDVATLVLQFDSPAAKAATR